MSKQIYNIVSVADLITSANLICGLLSVQSSLHHMFLLASLLMIAGVVFDMMDGFTARKLGVASEFGAQMDSLADLITFGVAPMVLVASYYDNVYLSLVAMLIPLCGALRLARHNVNHHDLKGVLIGVPIDASVLVVPLLLALGASPLVMAVGIVVLVAAYLSTVTVKKLL